MRAPFLGRDDGSGAALSRRTSRCRQKHSEVLPGRVGRDDVQAPVTVDVTQRGLGKSEDRVLTDRDRL